MKDGARRTITEANREYGEQTKEKPDDGNEATQYIEKREQQTRNRSMQQR